MMRGMERWLAGYLASVVRRPRRRGGVRHLLLCVADHFEPFNRTLLPDGTLTGGVDAMEARAMVARWCNDYKAALRTFRDADGHPPQHTFFYPWDEYDAACLDCLAGFCREGYGEVEIHLHHRNDTPEGLREKLVRCRDTYAIRHGLLGRKAVSGRRLAAGYAFVHGNWCLCNARSDGDWCGVNRELAILEETGCYADLTFPSAPSPTQPRWVNTLYYGRDPGPGRSGHEYGKRCVCGGAAGASSSGVLMIQGPLGLNWASRKWGVAPRLENGELSGANPPGVSRLRVWQRMGVHVRGRPEWVVVKLHTHGAVAANRAALLGPAMARFHRTLAETYSPERGWQLHYVTARELFNILKAAEAGCEGTPGAYRDYGIKPPPY